MVCELDQLVDVVAYPVDVVGKVRGVWQPILFFDPLLQDQSSQ
jgi:hypothetical protein